MTPTSFGSGICWQAKREMNGVLRGLVEFMDAVFLSLLSGTGIKRFAMWHVACGKKWNGMGTRLGWTAKEMMKNISSTVQLAHALSCVARWN